MKKILSVYLLLLLAAGMLFAATSVSGTAIPVKGSPSTAELSIKLDMSGGTGATSYWEVGFTEEAVDSDTTAITALGSTEVAFELDADQMIASYGGENKLYVYWSILSGTKASVKLYMEDQLSGSLPASLIHWSLVAGENDPIEHLYSKANAVEIFAFDPSINGVSAKGSMPVTVITDSLSGVTPDTYTGKLVLSIETAE